MKRSMTEETLRPLTREERLRLYLSHTYGPGSALSSAFVGGFQHLTNSPSDWGRGSDGFQKRVASAYGTHVVQGSVEYGAAYLLKEDNRYRRSRETGTWRRSKHAILSAFASTDAAGHRHFSWSAVGGVAAAATIRQAWQPSNVSGPGNAATGFSIMLSARVGHNLFREFYPDLTSRLLGRK